MTKNKSREWVLEGNNTLKLYSEIQISLFESWLIWRGKMIKIKFKIYKRDRFLRKTLTIYTDKKVYPCDSEISRNIESDNLNIAAFMKSDGHELRINLKNKSITITDHPIDVEINFIENTKEIFFILNQRNYFEQTQPKEGSLEHTGGSYMETITLFKNAASAAYNETTAYFLEEDLYISRQTIINSKKTEYLLRIIIVRVFSWL